MEKGVEDQKLLGNLPGASEQLLMDISQKKVFAFDIEKENLK